MFTEFQLLTYKHCALSKTRPADAGCRGASIITFWAKFDDGVLKKRDVDKRWKNWHLVNEARALNHQWPKWEYPNSKNDDVSCSKNTHILSHFHSIFRIFWRVIALRLLVLLWCRFSLHKLEFGTINFYSFHRVFNFPVRNFARNDQERTLNRLTNV